MKHFRKGCTYLWHDLKPHEITLTEAEKEEAAENNKVDYIRRGQSTSSINMDDSCCFDYFSNRYLHCDRQTESYCCIRQTGNVCRL